MLPRWSYRHRVLIRIQFPICSRTAPVLQRGLRCLVMLLAHSMSWTVSSTTALLYIKSRYTIQGTFVEISLTSGCIMSQPLEPSTTMVLTQREEHLRFLMAGLSNRFDGKYSPRTSTLAGNSAGQEIYGESTSWQTTIHSISPNLQWTVNSQAMPLN